MNTFTLVCVIILGICMCISIVSMLFGFAKSIIHSIKAKKASKELKEKYDDDTKHEDKN